MLARGGKAVSNESLTEEIADVLKSLNPEDRKRIKPDLAEKAIKTAFDIHRRGEKDRGNVIRFTLSRHHIGSQGQSETRQKTFRAYWRLLRRILDNRELAKKLGKEAA